MTNSSYIEHLCMGCMREKDNDDPCPYCGLQEQSYLVAPHHLPLRSILNGKYLAGKVLGEGGFGITYLGWDLNLDLKIAIKEYYPTGFVTRENTVTATVTPYTGEKTEFFTEGRDKFVNEAKSLAKFYTLPGIVSVKDFFLENGTAYIVMEFVEGETLKQRLLQSGGKLPAAQVLEMMKPLMRSLEEIHKAGIIHRDISPDNLMITKEGNVKLLDFGAARDFEDSGNKSLSVMLKPGYAPEEQYRSRGKQGPWTDVYALCATIYRAIAGVTPDESIERMQNDQVKTPFQLGISIASHEETALFKGMAVMQKDRYQNIAELYKALYFEPVTASVPGVTVPILPHSDPDPASVTRPVSAPKAIQNPDWNLSSALPPESGQNADIKAQSWHSFFDDRKHIGAICVACVIILAAIVHNTSKQTGASLNSSVYIPGGNKVTSSASSAAGSESAGINKDMKADLTISISNSIFDKQILPEQLKKIYPNVAVKVNSITEEAAGPGDILAHLAENKFASNVQYIEQAISVGNGPDIFLVKLQTDFNEASLATLVKGKYIIDLSDLKIWGSFNQKECDKFAYEDRVYAVPNTSMDGYAYVISSSSKNPELCKQILSALYDSKSSLCQARQDDFKTQSTVSKGVSQNNENSASTASSGKSQATSSAKNPASSQESKIEYGSVEFEVNGVKHTLYALMPAEYENQYWYVAFFPRDCNNILDAESLSFSLPQNIAGGDILTDTFNSGNNYPLVYESGTSNQCYMFPFNPQGLETLIKSTCLVSVDRWEGSGGICKGTFEGQLTLTNKDVISFTNGKFEFKIKANNL